MTFLEVDLSGRIQESGVRIQNKEFMDFQQINYSILWGGCLASFGVWAGKMPTPQEVVEYFLLVGLLCNKLQSMLD
ncbi:hypothetical protein H6G93_23260 [Nostoc sp. FACHB-973]|uniref:Uncharacterized protein n=1 Tax=Desmonostoc muscorum LEGE 12446 TaxID=1828758 RepID=A0A8J7AH84_DESMC|nr:hypothetical protein [Desmonostoc muscorum]MBD2517843.1 hypothetical protein [Nostoc sp. FACHB-973]MBX9255817.1 hypothetical protein [Desmonostoc muscorum CCALA 125]MCF2150453.1 hypothetical protein [Desmonostoc muscorum LEGE 12446]